MCIDWLYLLFLSSIVAYFCIGHCWKAALLSWCNFPLIINHKHTKNWLNNISDYIYILCPIYTSSGNTYKVLHNVIRIIPLCTSACYFQVDSVTSSPFWLDVPSSCEINSSYREGGHQFLWEYLWVWVTDWGSGWCDTVTSCSYNHCHHHLLVPGLYYWYWLTTSLCSW